METKNKARMSAPETTVAQREEKYKEQGIQVQSKFLKWLDNYWYHYKWHTILIGFFAFVMIVCFVQCSTAEDHDVTVCFSGNEIFLENEYAEIKKVLGDVCPFDANQDGDNTAAFKTISAFEELLISGKNERSIERFAFFKIPLSQSVFNGEVVTFAISQRSFSQSSAESLSYKARITASC